MPESHHIGKILIDPQDANRIIVAVLGHLYTDNPERGVYVSTDGGDSWEHSLFVNEKTGVVDLIMDPSNSNILYAASWQRDRKAWNFIEAGEGSALYKSVDGAKNWVNIIDQNSGFPSGNGAGRIGLGMSRNNAETRLYALIDNYDPKPQTASPVSIGLTKNDFENMDVPTFLKLDDDDLNQYLRRNNFPQKHNADKLKEDVKSGKTAVSDLKKYVDNANAALFETDVIGAELYVSLDEGRTWRKTHEGFLDGLYYTYGYYFGVIATHPTQPDIVYIAGVPILRSIDGGKTFVNINGDNVHVDHHKIWINPANANHLLLGNDGGINTSYDAGDSWLKNPSPPVGQFYYIAVDNATPYNVYGGLQDNGVWKGSHLYSPSTEWQQTGRYPYEALLGGDGMQVQIDTRTNDIVYTGFQFGNYFRINTTTQKREYITPRHELGESPYRWNWQTPIHLSVHNQDILYMGSNYLFRSLNQGSDFTRISDDLTLGGRIGDVAFGTLTAMHESPLKFGLLYTGSDDGLVYVSPDGGHSWRSINIGLPEDMWISRIQSSAHELSRVYVSLNGYRHDHFDAYIYRSNDYGDTWERLGLNLPKEPVNVIKEDPHYADILYVGTDRGVYISLDQGKSFEMARANIPNVPVHDIVVQERDKHLLIGSHGRSIYLNDLKPLYALYASMGDKLQLVDIPNIKYRPNVGNRRSSFSSYGSNNVDIFFVSPAAQNVTLELLNAENKTVFSHSVKAHKGINLYKYDTSIDHDKISVYNKSRTDNKADVSKQAQNGSYYLQSGKYTIVVSAGNRRSEKTLEIK